MGNNLRISKENKNKSWPYIKEADKMSFLDDSTGISKPDTSLSNLFQKKLLEYFGEDLSGVFLSGNVKADMPFGVTSKYNVQNRSLNFQKSFGKDYKFDLDINKRSPFGDFRNQISLGVTKKF